MLPPIFSLPPPLTTTSHLYTTHHRVLGSGNGGLERVGRSRRFGKQEGIGKDTGKPNQPPLGIPAKEPPHPPSALLCCPHPGPLYPKQRHPTILLPKLSPGGSAFGFLVPTRPSRTMSNYWPPHNLKCGVFHPIWIHLDLLYPKINAPMFHWPKLSPGGLVLDVDSN
jgi:hypothetical protein